MNKSVVRFSFHPRFTGILHFSSVSKTLKMVLILLFIGLFAPGLLQAQRALRPPLRPQVITPIRPRIVVPPLRPLVNKCREKGFKTVTAQVVVLDQVLMFNRLGAQNVNGIIYALRRDIVSLKTFKPENQGGSLSPGQVQLRPDKRPRPLVLRVNKGQCLKVRFTNFLAPAANPNLHANPVSTYDPDPYLPYSDISDDQVKERMAGFHPAGLEYVNSIRDSGSFVGRNKSALVSPGQSITYTYYAKEEGAYLVTSTAATFGGEATAGNIANGMYAVVNVEPVGASYYRSQVTEEELRLATIRKTSSGLPILNYEKKYPKVSPWIEEGKAGLPILNMVHNGELVHSDLNAVVAGNKTKGWQFSPTNYVLESKGLMNPTVPNRLEPFREFTAVFHDEAVSAQAFPGWFEDRVLSHTLHGVRDSFMINYGAGGAGAEIIANRLGVGPMHDCLSCAYEEFFLSSFSVGDAAMLVDIPANFGLEGCTPNSPVGCENVGPKAKYAYYPDDPSNVHHSYINDGVRFRNLHAGKEQHVYHLHANQWLANPNDENSTYLDSQAVGVGSAFTYEIAFGGSGNRNKEVGDSIFHCHFYPHFAQGMWEMWRTHDTFESGTYLQASLARSAVTQKKSFHRKVWGLQNGMPSKSSRALPDGEILRGTPIPAVVPLPGKPMAPMPGKVIVVTKDSNGDHVPDSSQAKVIEREKNPGYPFFIAGIESIVGQRPPTPPLDMLPSEGGWDGGLPRHALEGSLAGGEVGIVKNNRLDFTKEIDIAKPKYFPEEGTDIEQVAMKFHSEPCHNSFFPDGSAATCTSIPGEGVSGGFVTNGNKPVSGAPYAEPCIDDRRQLLVSKSPAYFFGAKGKPSKASTPQFGGNDPRVYKGANIQLDVVFNKKGHHFSQQRIVTLWEDVIPSLTKIRPPEPFVMRLNTYDCAKYLHTNLVPKDYEMDDYQVRTPTDIIGQHIHLVKFDVTSSDGSGNGWNYEDGTLSPGAVQERIHSINKYNAKPGVVKVPTLDGRTSLNPLPHPFFGALDSSQEDAKGHKKWDGARTTIQRWFADPILNTKGEDRGLGIVFTHDHFGPSTHQQVGLYATLLVEPERSKWKHNETGIPFYTRSDGGPTSWQAIIEPKDLLGKPVDLDKDGKYDSFREFFLEFSDFQHAYQAGVYIGIGPNGDRVCPEAQTVCVNNHKHRNSFRDAINPSYRLPTKKPFPDIQYFPSTCPGSTLSKPVRRPCPEAISADDVGMMVVNYRNEPVALRVYDPQATGPDGKKGRQGKGMGSDLGFALQTRTDRKILAFNTKLGDTPYGALTGDIHAGDPFTPLMRVEEGDFVRVKIQSGGYEHEHNGTIHGLKWLQAGGGFGKGSPTSGWRNSQNLGISEQASLAAPIGFRTDSIDEGCDPERTDHAYTIDASQDGWWTGVWGLLRTYQYRQKNLSALTLRENERGRPKCQGIFHPRRFVKADLSKLSPKFLETPVNKILEPFRKRLAPPLSKLKMDRLLKSVPNIDLSSTDKMDAIGQIKPKGAAAISSAVLKQMTKMKIKPPTRLRGILSKELVKKQLPQAKLRQRKSIDLKEELRANIQKSFQDAQIRDVQDKVFREIGTIDIGKLVDANVRSDLNNLDVRSITLTQIDLGATGKAGLKQEVLSRFDTKLKDSTLRSIFNTRQSKERFSQEVEILLKKNIDLSRLVWRKDLSQPGTSCPARANLRSYEVHAVLANDIIPKDLNPNLKLLPSDSSAKMHVGATPDPAKGTLIYNKRKTSIKGGEVGPLHDPTAMMYVLDSDLGKIKAGKMRPLPLVLRANAGDCIKVTLHNDLPQKALDLASYTTLLQVARRERNGEDGGMTTFQNNLIRPSSHVGLHPQLVHYDMKEGDGTNVGLNPEQTVPPGFSKVIYWYAGDVSQVSNPDGSGYMLKFTPLELGGTNLMPADKIKQGQKGLVGGLVVEPAKALWREDKNFRTSATVTRVVKGVKAQFRDFMVVYQKGLALRYGDGSAVESIASEAMEELPDARSFWCWGRWWCPQPPKARAPEDSHDAGQMAINYRTEPMWFRYGVAADTDFLSEGPGNTGLATLNNLNRAYSNIQAGSKDPETPVFHVRSGTPFRMRVLMPTGVGRASNFGLGGHVWQRFPYLETNFPSDVIGDNKISHYKSSQESLTPAAHFDMVFPSAGGTFKVKGDYLFRDNGSFGHLNGLWGIIRVEPSRLVLKPIRPIINRIRPIQP